MPKPGTRQQAAQQDLAVLAVLWPQVEAVQPGFRLADLNGKTSSEEVASLSPGARVVKAATHQARSKGSLDHCRRTAKAAF